MSIITGYPVGSKLISDLYTNGQISKTQSIRTAAFCSTSGPMFILGTVAIGMFASQKMGYIILISHILGALINGLIYRNIKEKINNTTSQNCTTQQNNVQIPTLDNLTNKTSNKSSFDFSQSINSSINSILLIGGVVCFSFVLLEVITTSTLFQSITNVFSSLGINNSLISSIFCGLGEIICLTMFFNPLSGVGLFYIVSLLCGFVVVAAKYV